MRRSRPDDRRLSHPGDGGQLARACRAEVRRTKAGGKSELRRAVRRVTPGQSNLTDQWHRKDTAPRLAPSGLARGKPMAIAIPGLASSEPRRGESRGKGEKVR